MNHRYFPLPTLLVLLILPINAFGQAGKMRAKRLPDRSYQVTNAQGEVVLTGNYKEVKVRNQYVWAKTAKDSVFVFNSAGKQVHPAFLDREFFISNEGVLTIRNFGSGPITYVDLDLGKTIAKVKYGYNFRGNYASVQKGEHWFIINRKGETLEMPNDQALKAQLDPNHGMALLTYLNPEFDEGAPDRVNRYQYMVMNLENGAYFPIVPHPQDFTHYRMAFNSKTVQQPISGLGIVINEAEPKSEMRVVIYSTSYELLVTKEGEIFPAKGKYNKVNPVTIRRPGGNSVVWLKVTLNFQDENGRRKSLYGLTDAEGNIIIKPEYDELSVLSKGIRIQKGKLYGLYSLDGKELISPNSTQKEYYEALRKIDN